MARKAQLAKTTAATKETTSNGAALKKKPAAAAKCTKTGNRRITARDWQSVVAGLKGSEELPKKVQKMFANLLGQSLLESEHPYEEQAVAEVGEAIAEIEARLSKAVEQAKAVVDDTNQGARQEALRQAEAYIETQKHRISESKLAIKDSCKAVQTAKEELKSAHSARKTIESEQKKIGAQITRLEAAEKETFQPLKEMSAGSPDGLKMVKTLRKVGKDFAFHDVLMNVLPVVLKKQPDRRHTFDNLTMQQFEAECSKHVAAMESTRADTDAAISSSSDAAQAAQAALHAAEAQHTSSTKALSESEENLLRGKKMLLEARQRVRRFDSDTRKAARDLEQASLQLSSFQEGAAAAFRELRMRPSATASVEVTAFPAASLEAEDQYVTEKAEQKDAAASLEAEKEGREAEKKEKEADEEKETEEGKVKEDDEEEAQERQDEEDGEEEGEEEEDDDKEAEEGHEEEDAEEEAEEGEEEEDDEKEEETVKKAHGDELEIGGEETQKEEEAAKGAAAGTEEPSTKRAKIFRSEIW